MLAKYDYINAAVLLHPAPLTHDDIRGEFSFFSHGLFNSYESNFRLAFITYTFLSIRPVLLLCSNE
jgi:hypothetical protein